MKVVWAIPAVRDVEQHVASLAEVNPIAARDLAQTLISLGDSLSVFPVRGRAGRIPGSRELLAASPYVMVYEVGDSHVTILRVWHGKLLT